MGALFYIVCIDCKKKLCIGQSGMPIWFRNEKTMLALSDFFIEHQLHAMTYDHDWSHSEDEERVILEEMDEIKIV